MTFAQKIDQIYYTLNKFSPTLKPHYDIYYCNLNSTSWLLAMPKTNDIIKFKSFCSEVYEKFMPDALKINVYLKNTVPSSYTVKIAEAYFPLIDDVEKPENNKNIPVTKTNDDFLGFVEQSKSIEMERIKDKYDNEMRIIKLEQRYEIDKLNTNINALLEKNQELESENSELAEEIEQMQQKIEEYHNLIQKSSQSQMKQFTALGGILAGKFMNMETQEILQLAGILNASDDDEDTTQSNKQIKAGGVDLEEETERSNKEKSIVTFMRSLDENVFNAFYLIVHSISNETGAFEKVLDVLGHTKKKSDNDTPIEETN
jgi:hypothetical protein